jgi:plastocyanin
MGRLYDPAPPFTGPLLAWLDDPVIVMVTGDASSVPGEGGEMKRLLVPVVLTVALSGAACSGDSTDETTTTVASSTTAATTTTTIVSSTTAATTTTAAQSSTTAEAAENEVSIFNFSFNPGDLVVPVGATVTWTNGDSSSHTTSSDDNVWDSGVLDPGDSFEVVFDAPGAFSYHCNIHTSMKATVTVEG